MKPLHYHTYHCQYHGEVIPPEGSDNEDASDDAEEQEQDNKSQEKCRECHDGFPPVALVCRHDRSCQDEDRVLAECHVLSNDSLR